MTTRKHAVELALNFYSDGLVLIHPKDIVELDDPDHPYAEVAAHCHIYLIAKRPRLTFVPDSLFVGDDRTTVRLRFVRNGVPSEVTTCLNGRPNADVVEVSGYPHTSLLLKTAGTVTHVLPAYTASFMGTEISDLSVRDLEVVYLGMSYADGTRSAKDRLASHSTLQQVLADLNGSEPDNEALILMAEFAQPMVIMSIDGRTRPTPDTSRNVGADFARAERELTEDLQISLIEAALIRYFEPPYNDKYKRRFPHPTHKILEELYSIDFGALSVELNVERVNVRLFSAARGPGHYHMTSHDLHDPAVRRSFFNIMNVDDGPDASAMSGPMF